MNKTFTAVTFICWSMLAAIFLFTGGKVSAQAKLVINGAVINISNGATLTLGDSTNIVRNGAGYIKSEGAGNSVYWKIGAGNGNTYLIPFGNETAYFPIQFGAAGGLGNGYFVFSTYPTATWKNSDQLPPGVTNVNKDGADNSAKMIDRFWQISPRGYTKNPSLSNVLFTYNNAELAAPNSITAVNLVAQRWNPALQSWNDTTLASTINTAGTTVSVAAAASDQLFNWWTLTDRAVTVNSNTTNFKAVVSNTLVLTSWQTLMEQNLDHFEVWRSKDGITFEYVGSVTAAGNSAGIKNYSFTDANPFTGVSYYQLKITDKNGAVKLSPVVSVFIDFTTGIFLTPNPAVNYISINSSSAIINSKPEAVLYSATGQMLQRITLTSTSQQLNTARLAPGVYQLVVTYNRFIQTLRFIKK